MNLALISFLKQRAIFFFVDLMIESPFVPRYAQLKYKFTSLSLLISFDAPCFCCVFSMIDFTIHLGNPLQEVRNFIFQWISCWGCISLSRELPMKKSTIFYNSSWYNCQNACIGPYLCPSCILISHLDVPPYQENVVWYSQMYRL